MTDAEKRDRVIRGLTYCIMNGMCPSCPYYMGSDCIKRFHIPEEVALNVVPLSMAKDALDLLREQDPRVIDLSEINPNIYVWVEDRQEHTVFPLRGGMFDPDGDDYFRFLENVECDYVYWSVGNYGYSWRVWDKCPTPEQMRDTKWEAESE